MRVLEDLLEFDPEGIALLEGNPFTGESYWVDQWGKEVFSCFYESGILKTTRQWYSTNDQLMEEATYMASVYHGTYRKWHLSGSIMCEAQFEYGICLEMKKWSEVGILTENYTLPEDVKNANYRTLLILRDLYRTEKI